MKFADLTDFIKDFLQTEFPELPIILEDKGDIEYEANNAIAKQGVYMLIRFPQFVFQGISNDKLGLTATSMIIQISENVPVNRHKTEFITANAYSFKVAKVVMDKLKNIVNLVDVYNDYVDGLMISTVNFETTFNITD